MFVKLLGFRVNRSVKGWCIDCPSWLWLWRKSSCWDTAWTSRWPGLYQ